ncbi:hypothetical protein MMC30_007900 [Trapelia coarctata]|nr:hypothetical protein [Trapelia coarctata]
MNKYKNCTRVAMHNGKKIGEIRQFQIDSKFSGWLLEYSNGTFVYVRRSKPGANCVQVHEKRVYSYDAWLGEDRGWNQSTLFTTYGPEPKDTPSMIDLENRSLPRQASLDSVTVASSSRSHYHENRGSIRSTASETVGDQFMGEASDQTVTVKVLPNKRPIVRDQSQSSPQTVHTVNDHPSHTSTILRGAQSINFEHSKCSNPAFSPLYRAQDASTEISSA